MSTEVNEEESKELFSVQKKRVLEGGDGQDNDGDADAVNGQKKGRYAIDTSTIPAALQTIPNIISYANDTLIFEVPFDKVAHIIGSKGLVIQDIQTRSSAKAYINQDFPAGVNRQMHLSGNIQQIRAAADLVQLIITNGPTAIHMNSLHGGPQTSRVIECPLEQVGKVIGSRGDVIKDIQSKSGARIQIDQNFPPQIPRKINITGTVAAVNAAAELVLQAMNSVSKPPQASNLAPGDGVDYMEVPKPAVGKIIGSRGEHINIIQKRSACDVQVDQSGPSDMPCRVTIKGLPHNIAIAKQLISEVLQGIHISKIGYNAPQPMSAGMAGMQNPYMGAMGAYGMPPQNPYMPYPGYPPQPNPAAPYAGYPPAGYGYPYMAPGQAAPQTHPAAHPAAHPSAHGHHAAAPQGYGNPYGAPAAAPVATPVPPKPASSVWTEHKTEDGLTYWYNATTGVSQWERPLNM